MAAQAQAHWAKQEKVMTFQELEPGDEFTFRPDFDIWYTVDTRPKLTDIKRERMVLGVLNCGKTFAYAYSRVMVRRWIRT